MIVAERLSVYLSAIANRSRKPIAIKRIYIILQKIITQGGSIESCSLTPAQKGALHE
jgi:hypothetical protein